MAGTRQEIRRSIPESPADSGPQTDRILVHRAAESVTLPASRGIAPHQLLVIAMLNLETANVLIRHGWLGRLRHNFLPNQICSR